MDPFITEQLIKMINQRIFEANLLILYETAVKWFCFWKGLSNYEYPGCVPGGK